MTTHDSSDREQKVEITMSESEYHELLMAYAVCCEEDGALSERAVRIRLDLATHYNDIKADRQKAATEARVDELENYYRQHPSTKVANWVGRRVMDIEKADRIAQITKQD